MVQAQLKPLVSIIIPISVYHADISVFAIASARSQTLPVTVITVEDKDSRGAGWSRNRGLEQVKTPWIIFLDADDTIAETFVEKTLRAYESGHYVYTDWKAGNKVHFTDSPWQKGEWHPVTALLPTEVLFNLNGFREDVPGGEDSEFYYELVHAGICPIRVAEPLFIYSEHGLRGKNFVGSPAHQDFIDRMIARYGNDMANGCCGDNGPAQWSPDSEELKPGFIWARALWGGNRDQRGTISGLMYRHTGNGKIIQVDKRDVAHRPDLWQAVIQQTFNTPAKPNLKPFQGEKQPPFPKPPPPAQGVREVAQALWPNHELTEDGETTVAIRPAKVNPDVKGILALAKGVKLEPHQQLNTQGEIIAKDSSLLEWGAHLREEQAKQEQSPVAQEQKPAHPPAIKAKKPGRPRKNG